LKRILTIGCIGLVFILMVVCGGAIFYETTTPWFDYPSAAVNVAPGNSYCASELCHHYASYDLAGSHEDLVRFYREKGYDCQEIRGPSDGGLFPHLPDPYWQCTGKAFPRGDVDIGFKPAEIHGSGQMIKVQVHVTWEPIM
jgi:hypothetical protein